MKNLFLSFCLALTAPLAFTVPAVAVIDFDSGSWCTAEEAAVMTDAFRNEMVRSGKADIVTRSRLDTLKSEIRFQMSDWADPSKIKQAGRMIGADLMIFGRFGVMGSSGYLQVEMAEVETARIAYSARMTLTAWREFDSKVTAFAKEFIGKLPVENIFTGTWTADVPYNGGIDRYTLTFSGASRCAVKAASMVDGGEITVEAQGTYSFDGDILKIQAVFRNSPIPHLSSIQWASVISTGGNNAAFNMLVKSASASADQVRVTFTRG